MLKCNAMQCANAMFWCFLISLLYIFSGLKYLMFLFGILNYLSTNLVQIGSTVQVRKGNRQTRVIFSFIIFSNQKKHRNKYSTTFMKFVTLRIIKA